MDLDMFKHPSTQSNFEKLASFGNIMIPAGEGELASGLSGKGRMAEPEEILSFIENHIHEQLPLKNKTCLVTAGPTYEAIDPVRFIGNHSSGKMGAAISLELANRGARVILIMGPSHADTQHESIERHNVTSAQEMYESVHQFVNQTDIAIFSAAVADYRPVNPAQQKIKKKSDTLSIELVKNPDILASVGAMSQKPFLVGFALETENEMEHAFAKAEKKQTDLLVLNSMRDEGAGFGKDTNKISIIDKDKNVLSFGTKSKTEVAKDIVDEIIKRIIK
jgi:phosphopantothenoylcysteine decarboxylase/phosphopantothenate--cysteine ligase